MLLSVTACVWSVRELFFGREQFEFAISMQETFKWLDKNSGPPDSVRRELRSTSPLEKAPRKAVCGQFLVV